MNRERVETFIWIFCIIVCIALTVRTNLTSDDYNCGECTVTLFNEMAGTDLQFEYGTFVIADLFNEYMKGNCELSWNSTQGYTHNG